MSLLEVHGLRAGYGGVPVLHGVSFSVEVGEIVAVVGRNGMGKTTLARALVGTIPADSGTVLLDGVDVTAERPSARFRRGLASAAQEQAVFQQLSVRENLELGGLRRGRHDDVLGLFADALQGRSHQTAGTLSGGEQKMLAVARALACEAALLVMDEPTEGLQPSNVDLLGDHLTTIRDQGRSVLLIEQHLALAHRLADRFLVLEKGQVADHGEAGDPDLTQRISARLVI